MTRMDPMTRLFIIIHLALQLPVYALASFALKQSRLRGTAASTWRREIQTADVHNGHNTEEQFMTLCQAELKENAENGVVSHDDYAAFLARYCRTNPAWACTYDTSYFWRLDPRLQRSFISERCPGDLFHQEECLEYFAEHPEQTLGYSGDLAKLCSAVKHLLVPTGLVWEITDTNNVDTPERDKGEASMNVEGGTRSQELELVDDYSGGNGKSKGSRKRAKNNDDALYDGKDEGKEKEEKEESRRDGGEKDKDKTVVGNSNEDRAEETGGTSTIQVATGDQNIPVDADDFEGSLKEESSLNLTGDSSRKDSVASKKDGGDKKPRKDQKKNEMSEGSQDADNKIPETNDESQNGSPPTASPRPKAEDMPGSQRLDENGTTNEKENGRVEHHVIAIVGSVAFVLLLGITHRTKKSLNKRNTSALLKQYADPEEDEDLSISSDDSCLFQASGQSTLEAALSFIDQQHTRQVKAPTTRQKGAISSFFARLVQPVLSDGAGNTTSDSDSAAARCDGDGDDSVSEDLSRTDELATLNNRIQPEKLTAERRGWRNRRIAGGFSRMYRKKNSDVGVSVDRILSQIKESPCESEVSEDSISISEFTESSLDEIVDEKVRERFKEFDSKPTTEFLELNAQMLDPTDISPFTSGYVSSDASSFRSIRDRFETRAGCEYVYRGGAGSSGPDSSTASDAESSCSSTVESVPPDSFECGNTSSASVLGLKSSYEQLSKRS